MTNAALVALSLLLRASMVHAYVCFLVHYFVVNTSQYNTKRLAILCTCSFVACLWLDNHDSGIDGSVHYSAGHDMHTEPALEAGLLLLLLGVLVPSLRSLDRIERINFVVKHR
jgi:hypothetical protein